MFDPKDNGTQWIVLKGDATHLICISEKCIWLLQHAEGIIEDEM